MNADTSVDTAWMAVRINRAVGQVGSPPPFEEDVELAADLTVVAETLLGQIEISRVRTQRRARVQRAVEVIELQVKHGCAYASDPLALRRYCEGLGRELRHVHYAIVHASPPGPTTATRSHSGVPDLGAAGRR
ncbi:hypothetical protein [Streptomyces sp. NPDC048442]|uniref:hypothetical protein n=1 Tax=Streptomyces sp. NPDC048442 TaxID=3154823 RepID=UPI003431F2CD